jgi:hypothetical protein
MKLPKIVVGFRLPKFVLALLGMRTKKMWVSTVDGNSKDVGPGHWVDIPKPKRFSGNGFAHIESYVSRLLQSSASYASLIITAPDQNIGGLLWRRGSVPVFSLMFQGRLEAKREQAARQFFGERKLSTEHDYLAGDGTTRCLGYCLPPDVPFISRLTKDVLQQIYQVHEQDTLDITYQEHERAS